jgi:hypothetical protein
MNLIETPSILMKAFHSFNMTFVSSVSGVIFHKIPTNTDAFVEREELILNWS